MGEKFLSWEIASSLSVSALRLFCAMYMAALHLALAVRQHHFIMVWCKVFKFFARLLGYCPRAFGKIALSPQCLLKECNFCAGSLSLSGDSAGREVVNQVKKAGS